ncbi:MAG: cell division protein ZapA [Firmicutes bacterium]|nr:cell division protein ZapA [Bacillota bacterium]
MEEKRINRVTVKILGEEYTIRGSGLPEAMAQAADYADGIMRSLAEKNRALSNYRVAVLAAINLADELLRLKQEYPRCETDDEKERDEEDELV